MNELSDGGVSGNRKAGATLTTASLACLPWPLVSVWGSSSLSRASGLPSLIFSVRDPAFSDVVNADSDVDPASADTGSNADADADAGVGINLDVNADVLFICLPEVGTEVDADMACCSSSARVIFFGRSLL